MKRLIKFKVETGGEIVVEAEVHEPVGGVVKAKSSEGLIIDAAQTFEQALEKIKPAAEAIMAKVCSLARPPIEAKVEFGVKMSADVGVLIASSQAEGNFQVSLTWRREGNAGES